MAAIQIQGNTFLTAGGIYEAVDLGLPSGLLWARCNIGANSEEEIGDYFVWGATCPIRIINSIAIDSTNNYISSYANQIKRDLLPNDDAASVLYGKRWRMPTRENFYELFDHTTITYTSVNGINGRKFVSQNGNYIFFPSCGYILGTAITGKNNVGEYWTRNIDDDEKAWRLDFSIDGYRVYNGGRSFGCCIRPVMA